MQKSISECTARWTLKQMGYSSRRTHLVPLLSAKNRKLRMQFSRAHQNWTTEDLKSLNFCCGIQMVGSEFGVNNMLRKSMVQAGGVGLMVWGIFSWHTLGLLVPTETQTGSNSWTWQWVHYAQMASRSQSRAPLGCSGIDATMTVMHKNLSGMFQHIVESMKWRIKPVLRAEGGPTQY